MRISDLFKKQTDDISITTRKPSTEESRKQCVTEYKRQQPAKKQKISTDKRDNDAYFRELNRNSMKHLQAGEIGFYRCELFNMARILEKEDNLLDALKQYMYVFYLDTTGINSFAALRMGLKPKPIVAPGVINRIRIIQNKLNLTDEDFKKLYFECPNESILPNAVFSYSDSYDLLIKSLNDGLCEADMIIEKVLKKYKLN